MLTYNEAMKIALERAKDSRGATAPNPPVGAVALDPSGRMIASAAHPRAGGPHAEERVLELARQQGQLHQVYTLVVTLEPCNHYGKRSPCSEMLIGHKIPRVVIGTQDPNPNVRGQGAQRLRNAGIEVIEGVLQSECDSLIAPFRHWCATQRPWITVKIARDLEGSMIPPPGSKTFLSRDSLKLAHELRRRSDAILTGSGTILADNPLFTVRWVLDHPEKSRWLVVLDSRGRVPQGWLSESKSRGLQAVRLSTLDEAIDFLGKQGALEVLVEAGPNVTESVLKSGIWNECYVLQQTLQGEVINHTFNESRFNITTGICVEPSILQPQAKDYTLNVYGNN